MELLERRIKVIVEGYGLLGSKLLLLGCCWKVYLGQWKNSKADAHGVNQWGNGDSYEGTWVGCLKHGKATDSFTNGDVYTGNYAYG